MVSMRKYRKFALMGLVLMALALFAAPFAIAQEHAGAEEAKTNTVGDGLRVMGLAIGAGIAIGAAGLGTGRAQAAVGAGGAGAITEKPELFTNILILFAIPETIVVLGFVVAFMLLGQI